MKINKKLGLIALLISSLAFVGCDSLSKKQRAAIGAATGAVVGGLVGHQIDPKKGAVLGAVVGGVAGGAVGYYMDTVQEKLEKDLKKSGIKVERLDKSTIKLNLPSGLLFASNQVNISSSAKDSLSKIADILNKYKKMAVIVEGHADSSGNDARNLTLSKKRAEQVLQFLQNKNVMPERLLSRGHGESFPIASNDTASGRAQNRRVELFLRAIEKGKEKEAFSSVY